MELKNTIEMMIDDDYKERFKAEYYQLKIRLCKLMSLYAAWKNGELGFALETPGIVLEMQMTAMRNYRDLLEARAKIEGIEIDTTTEPM